MARHEITSKHKTGDRSPTLTTATSNTATYPHPVSIHHFQRVKKKLTKHTRHELKPITQRAHVINTAIRSIRAANVKGIALPGPKQCASRLGCLGGVGGVKDAVVFCDGEFRSSRDCKGL